MKKRILTVALVVALLATCFAGTLAYLTDTDQVTNEFTIGNIAIDLYETVKHTNKQDAVVNEEEGTDLGKGDDTNPEFEYASIMPGDTMEKIVTVENTGDNDAYIALVIKQENYYNFNQNIDEYYENLAGYGAAAMQGIIDDIFPNWNLLYDKTQVAAPNAQVRYTIDTLPAGGEATVLGVGYANHSGDNGGQYYNYSGSYFTNGKFYEAQTGEPNFLTISDRAAGEHDRVWIVYLMVPAGKTFTMDLTTVCPEYIDNNSINAFEGMTLDVKAFAIQAQGMDAKEAFAEVLKAGFDF